MDAIANLSGYQIREQLYAGLRTLVYRGIRESDGQPVVIKLLHNPLPNFSELVQFRNQYTIAKNLNLPSIVKPLSLEAYGNSYALIMEDFGGISLSSYLQGASQPRADTDENKPDRSLPVAEFLNFAIQLADILHYLSQNRVIHKDIKPANILINPNSKQVQLIDFSIASLLPRETQEIQNPNVLEGTLAYLSPEQTGRMNRGIDYRSDFYSLGVTFYQLLTGKLPFVFEDPMELVHCHLADLPISAHQINPEIPQVLSEIVSKLMEKNAENRYQSGLGLKYDLEICQAQLQQTGEIKAFVLGEQDICDRFIIPEKLYGRKSEVAELLAAFDRVANSHSQALTPRSPRSQALPGNEYQEALPPSNSEAEPLEMRYQALPGNENQEALPPSNSEAEPLEMRSQALPGNENQNEKNSKAEPLEMRYQAEPGNENRNLSRSEMMLVAGFSGIGKTVVVNEVQKPIVRQRGYFIKGKYDQFQRNIPFSAFVQAFRELIEQLLSESDADLEEWQTKIVNAVGENGQVIVEVIPELERIIGKQQPVSELLGNAAENRFNLVFQKFISVFTTKEHPLVIFLDDLQWSDSASLKLLQLLMGEKDSQNLLVIGAYRDNEVSPVHPFMLTVAEMEKAQVTINTITLEPLSQTDVNDLIADTLLCDRTLAQPLTDLVYQKTKGNPFFATQFLKSLQEDGLIAFNPTHEGNHGGIAPTENQSFVGVVDGACLPSPCLPLPNKGGWQCDIAKVKALTVSDDVVEFMALQLQKLPPETQDVLKLAACIGAQFDLNTLAVVSEKSPEETATNLWRSLQEGFILPTSEVYKFYQGKEERETTDILPSSAAQLPNYKFLHDRVQQAAYSLIPDTKKQSTHLQIGQLLLPKFSEIEKGEEVFDIINHFIIGSELITQEEERTKLAKISLFAGQRAKLSTAYESGTKYLAFGLNFLPIDKWKSVYELTFTMYLESIETEFLVGNFDKAENLVEIGFANAKSSLDRAKVIAIQLTHYQNKALYKKVIQVGIEGLKLLGLELPIQPNEANLEAMALAVKRTLNQRAVAGLIDAPVIVNEKQQMQIKLLMNMVPPTYLTNQGLLVLVVLHMTNLCLEYGNINLAGFVYVWYGTILCQRFQDYELGYEFGLLALNVNEKFNNTALNGKIYMSFGNFINHWRKHVSSNLVLQQAAYQGAMEVGDFSWCHHSVLFSFWQQAIVSSDIHSLLTRHEKYISFAERTEITTAFALILQCKLLENLQGLTIGKYSLSSATFDEESALATFREIGYGYGSITYYFAKAFLLFTYGDYAQAYKMLVAASEFSNALYGQFQSVLHCFYQSLSLLQLDGAAAEQQPKDYREVLHKNRKQLQVWARECPENCLSKFMLLEAEMARVAEEKWQAADYYDRAIQLAKENQFLNEEALANELCAKFYLEWGKEKVAQAYMQEAYYCYARWGAKAKIDDLETRYPQLLTAILQVQPNNFSISDTQIETLDRSSVVNQTIHTTRYSSSISESLDFATILKASQALSSEIELEKLVTILMQVVMENSGAKKAALLLLKDDILMVEALADTTQTISILSVPVSSVQEIPVTLIHYVKRSLKTVVIDDATTENNFSADPYLMEEQPKSVLCAPILNQGKLIGLLYLENKLTIGAFTRDRTELIQLLCTQAAISLENARLYKQSQIHAEQLERALKDLQDSQTQLIKSAAFLEAQRESSLDGILVIDANRQVSAYNQGFVKLWNIPQIILETKDDFQLLGFVLDQLEQPNEFLAMVEYLYQHPGEASYHEISLKDRRILERSSVTVKLPSGDECGRIWYFRDISDRKEAEINLQQTNLLLESVLEATSDMIFAKDSQHRFLFANPATLQLLGLSTESEVVGKTDFDVLPLEFAQNVREWDERVLCSGIAEKFEEDVPNSRGQIVNLYTTKTPMRDPNGNIIGTVGMTRDITEIKVTEINLQQSNMLLESVLESTSDIIFAKDSEHRYLFANSATLQFLGLSEAQMVGKTDFEAFPLEFANYVRECDDRVLRSGIAETFEENILNAAGKIVTLYTTKTPMRDRDGNITGMVGITRDISDRKQAEAAILQKSQQLEQTLDELKQAQLQMVQNEKMATLGNLVAGVAHEINNPIGFITGSVNNIEEYIQDLLTHLEYYQKFYPEPVPELSDHAEDIDLEFLIEDLPKLIPSMKIASQRIRDISNSLRTFSRADTAEKVACNIHEGLNSTLLILKYRLKASEKRPAIEVVFNSSKLPLVKCFLGQLNQVFMNIIANAIEALDAASVGQTFTEIQANPQLITISTEVSGDGKMAVIRIRDNGPGMSEEVRSHIFEHLFTTKEVGQGTGLGLAIARQIVEEKHGGKLSCISAPSKGTEFVIEILID